MTNAKMTEKVALTFVVENCELPTDVKEKIEAMIETRENRASTVSKAKQALRDENDRLRELILTYLADGEVHTIADIRKNIEGFVEFSSSKISSLVKPLVDTGTVLKTYEKRVPQYSLA